MLCFLEERMLFLRCKWSGYSEKKGKYLFITFGFLFSEFETNCRYNHTIVLCSLSQLPNFLLCHPSDLYNYVICFLLFSLEFFPFLLFFHASKPWYKMTSLLRVLFFTTNQPRTLTTVVIFRPQSRKAELFLSGLSVTYRDFHN
jgi:hypothetical protein